MPNYFDQFDAQPPAPPAGPAQSGNFFDQFDEAPANAAPASTERPNYAVDTLKSFGSGIVRGGSEMAMLPVTAHRLAEQGSDYLYDKGDAMVRALFGMPPADPAQRAAVDAARAGSYAGKMDSAIYGAQDSARGAMDSVLHAPETTPGKFAQTIGEFVAPGGLPSDAARAAPTLIRKGAQYAADLGRTAVIPGVASESAGQLTEGTAVEPYARVLAAIVANAGVGLSQAANTPEAMLRRAAGPADQIDWARALGLQDNTTGIRLTGPEAITQAQGGASALPQVQRIVEGTVDGSAKTRPFFSARPGQVDNAVGSLLDKIGPQSDNPAALGPRAAQAAEGAIAVSPEGQALVDAIFNTGPRTTAQQAGEVIQPALRETYDRREGMRNAMADQAYEAARASAPTIPVPDLPVSRTVREPSYTSLRPGEDEFGRQSMQPTAVPPVIETPNMTSRTGPDLIQADARPVLRVIDNLAVDARGGTVAALNDARNMLYSNGGIDTSVSGLESARKQIGDQITAATQSGQMQTAEHLLQVQRALDASLAAVPEYAQANDVFRAGSEPLHPFESPGMAKAVKRDEFNSQFSTPPEQVPAAVSTPSEAQNFNQVAPPEARTALGKHIATNIMDKARDGAGKVSPERLAIAMRDNEDVLRQFPEISQGLQSVVDAAGNLPNARVGTVGSVASAADTTAAANALHPQNPLVGSHGETADAARRLIEQDPDTIVSLIRQGMADRYSKAATETQGGNREFAGAKFHQNVAGNEQRRSTLDGVLGSLPTQDAMTAAPELLDVLQATGRRMPIGSATDFNRSARADLSAASPAARALGLVKSLGTSLVTNAGAALNRSAYKSSINTLADMFVDPKSVELIRDALGRSQSNGLAEAAARSAAQAPAIMERQRQ